MRYLRTGALVLACVALACSPPLASNESSLHGNVVLSRRPAGSSVLIAGTYLSVLDSLALTITSGGATQTIGRHLGVADTSLSIPVTLPAGVSVIAVQVLSNNRTLLFSGTSTSTIDRDGFSIAVALAAVKPVLVLIADTVATDSTIGISRFGTITVHNSGTDRLAWSAAFDPATAGQFCPVNVTFIPCTITPTSGVLAANGSIKVGFRITVPGNQPPTGSISYIFTSPEGNVTVRWRF